MIRDLTETVGNAVFESVGRASSRVQQRRPLPADLLESDGAYLAVFDAPGAAANDVSVRFEDRTLHVRVDRFREFHEEFEMRFPGRGLSLDGEVTLPDGADVDVASATATLHGDGTLHVEIPKSGESQQADIAVEDADDEDDEAVEPDDGE